MAVRIRLARHGRKKKPVYSIVVADVRAPRDGRFIEKLGIFNPNSHPAKVELHEDRALYWVMTGAQPTETARSILSSAGVMLRKHLQVGVLKGAITQETADSRFEEWKKQKDAKTGKHIFISKDNPVEEEVVPVVEEPVVVKAEAPVEETKPVEEEAPKAEEVETPTEEVKEETTTPVAETTEETPAETTEEPAAETEEEATPAEEKKTEE